ncbi:hypothetical protein CR513_11903, partial [Mucuna pruriens]
MDELIDEHMQIGTGCADLANFVEISNVINYFYTVKAISDSDSLSHIQNFPNSEGNIADLVKIQVRWSLRVSQVCNEAKTDSNIQEEVETNFINLEQAEIDSNIQEEAETNSINLKEVEIDSSRQLEVGSDSHQQESKQAKVEFDFGQLSLHLNRVGQPIPSATNQFYPPQSPPIELKPLPEHLKYAYLDDHQHFTVIIVNNLSQEQEEKLLTVLRKHKKAID